ncbi:MAG TPA: hypothetical protein VII63_04515 [Caulobacteraceae bacterium]
MARRRKGAKPTDPMEAARLRAAERDRERDPASWGVGVETLALAANDAVEASADLAGRLVRVRRNDVFALLHGRGKLSGSAHDAVRRLQADIAILHRTRGGASDWRPRVDEARSPTAFADARLRAGTRIEAALRLCGAASARLLTALCEPDVVLGRPGEWRGVVLRETDEKLADAQGAILRVACENLAGAYLELDRVRRKDTGAR